MDNDSNPLLYFDPKCSFCIKTKNIVSKLDRSATKFTPLSHENISVLGRSLQLSQHKASNVMYYKGKNGKLFYGSEAIFAYLRDKKGFLFAVGQLGTKNPIKWYTEKIYNLIALNRYRISFFVR